MSTTFNGTFARRTLLLIPLLLWGQAQGQNVSKLYQFPKMATDADVCLEGNATNPAGADYVSLTEAGTNQRGTLILDPLPAGQLVRDLNVKFEMRVNGGSTTPADGYSFNFGPSLFASNIGEDGTTTGLAVTFDTYDDSSSGVVDTAPAVEVVYDKNVKAGKSFTGTRWNSKAASYTQSGLSLISADFVPVEVHLTALDNGTAKVVVTFNKVQIIDTTVPYTPAKGWRIGVGARTGGFYEKHHIRNVDVAASTSAQLVINSQYGGTVVSPVVGSYTNEGGSSVTLDAPEYVYLDRYKNRLSSSDAEASKTAFYRAHCTGYDIGGQEGSGLTTTLTLQSDTVFNWRWNLEFLAEVHTGTEGLVGLSDSDVTDVTNQASLGRHFEPLAAPFTSVVNASVAVAGANPIQFSARGYVSENAANPPEHSLELSGTGDHLSCPDAGGNLTATDGSFSIDFWARLNPVTPATEQYVLALGDDVSATGKQIRVGFSAANGFFLTNNSISIEAPAACTDTSWHHWAAVNDRVANTITLYRDGKVVKPITPPTGALVAYTGSAVVTLGGRANGAITDKFFAGGLNNVRIWKKAMSLMDIRDSLKTMQYGTKTDLTLELPFDTRPELAAEGAYVAQCFIYAERPTTLDNMGAHVDWAQTYISPTLTVPEVGPNDVLQWPPMTWQESNSTNGYVSWNFTTNLQIDVGGTYSFYLSSDDGSSLTIDGQKVVTNDFVHDDASAEISGSSFLTKGTHTLEVAFFDAGPGRALKVSYECTTQNILKQVIPASKLTVPAASMSAYSEQNKADKGCFGSISTEGHGLIFSLKGFGKLWQPDATIADAVATVFPGFEYKPVLGTTTVNIDSDQQGAMCDWRRVYWMWDKQFELKVQVSSADSSNDSLAAVSRLPFFTTAGVSVDGTTSTISQVGGGVNTVLDKWITEDEDLTVGSVYRTPDRRFTLSGISGATNAFGQITLNEVVDGAYNSVSTRQYFFPAVTAPGSMILQYNKTIHRATVAIGSGFDASSLASANNQLVPHLPTQSAQLAATVAGPSAVLKADPAGDTQVTGGTGDAWQWDYVGRKWYPLRPGIYTLTWPDTNGYVNTIEITANFPAVTQTLTNWENPNGSRIGTAPSYSSDVVFAGTSAAFPANPAAHYHYLVSPNATESFAAALDRNARDRWYFKRMGFSEGKTATVNDTTKNFTETTGGLRSVLVYSYSPNAATIATYDLTKEMIAVRVVMSDTVDQPLPGRINQTTVPATVATRITSTGDGGLDKAGFGSGAIVYAISNYNAGIYNRALTTVGTWGSIYPVNWSGLFTAEDLRLRVGYYENPFLSNPQGTLHPDAAWPYTLANYDTVDYPVSQTASKIYIASQLGSEGVSQSGAGQRVFDPKLFGNLTIYQQPDLGLAGYNPNEEHALVAPSNKTARTGDATFAIGQSAVFALQNALNRTDRITAGAYTSDPWVLAQYMNLTSGLQEMCAYQVLTTRAGAAPFPALDPTTHQPVDAAGAPVPQPLDPIYAFTDVGFAGALVAQPYPLSLVATGAAMTLNKGGNILPATGQPNVRALWNDKNNMPWVVAGDGKFFYRFWYPLAPGFWYDADETGINRKGDGTPIAWLPEHADGTVVPLAGFLEAAKPLPQAMRYDSYWGDNYPVLKRGETLTYPGGEYKQDNPQSSGLPGVLGWASAELVFDSLTPSMVISSQATDMANGSYNFADFAAWVTRPLDTRATPVSIAEMPATLTPANTDKVSVVGTRWYFKALNASLGQRFYFDSLAGQMVFRGRINQLESGAPNLTQTPIQSYLLEPNFMSDNDVTDLKALADPASTTWNNIVDDLKKWSSTEFTTPTQFGMGIANKPEPGIPAAGFYNTTDLTIQAKPGEGEIVPALSLGIGAALVPNSVVLAKATKDPVYVTLAENNDAKASGTVALHVIRLGKERYRGSVQMVTPLDAFDDKIALNHTGDFGGNTAGVYYQWWVHDPTSLGDLKRPDESDAAGWTVYQQGLGLTSIQFTGRPDITLADKFFYVRYGAKEELTNANTNNNVPDGSVTTDSWRLIHPDASTAQWIDPTVKSVPYQWAGAFNSPQLQADGSHNFIPQLVMGWVKRVLDAINPYEARYSATFSGDAPASYSSMLQEAGAPYIGPVALNSAKNVIENVGLIQLYETVLQRAKDLTANYSDDGTNQALLLAATRLASLYELVAGEAYSDAQNSSLTLTDQNSGQAALVAANPYVFSFQNEVPSLLQEELALLRGTDFLKAYPVYNRLFWNYFKGQGEAAYNANYGVTDVTKNGVIDESDAAALYPMGHGDAWGHFLSASKMHYNLLQRSNYNWQARAEYYSLLGNVIPTDYLDEKSFARTAGAKARAGLEIVKNTYRDAYVADPAGQWQGYADAADPARAWGVSEWSARVGQAAWFDWLTGNAIVPAAATTASGQPAEDLDRIDRMTNQADLGILAGTLREIQSTLDGVNRGANPLGMDPDAISFGLDAFLNGTTWERSTHFEQIYARALTAAANAHAALDFVSTSEQNLRRIATATDTLLNQAVMQDLDYRNRLIGLLGTPYSGTIGSGKIFQDGYNGPDMLTYMYIDQTQVSEITPQAPVTTIYQATIEASRAIAKKLDFGTTSFYPENAAHAEKYFADFFVGKDFGKTYLNNPNHTSDSTGNDTVLVTGLPYSEASDYGFTAPAGWGRRSSPGEVQTALTAMVAAQIDLETAVTAYDEYVKKMQILTQYVLYKMTALNSQQSFAAAYDGIKDGLLIGKLALERVAFMIKHGTVKHIKDTADTNAEFIPKSIGWSNGLDWFSTLRGSIFMTEASAAASLEAMANSAELAAQVDELGLKMTENAETQGKEVIATYSEFLELLKELSSELKDEESKRLAISGPLLALHTAGEHVRAVEAQAFRVQDERTALNATIAAKAQTNRYSDMMTRISRNEAARKYESAMDNAQRYAWLAAKAYDYETSLSPGNPAAATSVLEEIVRTRQLGQWVDGEPQVGNGGLAELLAKLKANYDSLKGQIGLNNPQKETGRLSLRTEMLRIRNSSESAATSRWQEALAAGRVTDIHQVPGFLQYCRPFADPAAGPQPGLVIPFSTEINTGRNVFGNLLSAADHTYSVSNFSTKISSHAVWFEGYDVSADGKQQLSATPRIYLVPIGRDVTRTSDGYLPTTRSWNVVNQRIPTPFVINTSNLSDSSFMPATDSLNGSFAERLRFGDFRAYPTVKGAAVGADATYTDSRLFGRSVWNTQWLLVVPGATLGADPKASLDRFVQTVTDIQLQFETYSHQGQ